MKKNLGLFLLFFWSLTFSQVNWKSVSKIISEEKNLSKKVLIFFYSDQCTNCEEIERETFFNFTISNSLNQDFYTAKFNINQEKNIDFYGVKFSPSKNPKELHEFANFLNVRSFPCFLFLDENFIPIATIHGSLTAKELEPFIKFIAENRYLKENAKDNWGKYLRKYKSKIKD